MAEYIEREAAIDCLEKLFQLQAATARSIIEAVPAADVVPVVRCKDCKHGIRLVRDLMGNEGIQCRHGNIAHRLDWFCADGAKMDLEEDK